MLDLSDLKIDLFNNEIIRSSKFLSRFHLMEVMSEFD